jgi:glutamate-1-semialdehyde 2,1-aminomutase
MRKMEDIFFSGTFGGESLSLAAAKATIDKLKREPVIEHLWQTGRELQNGLLQLIEKHSLEDVFSILGNECLGYVVAKDFENTRAAAIRTMLLQKMIEHGVLTIGAMTMSYAFREPEMRRVLQAANESFQYIRHMLDQGDVERNMEIPVIEPIFAVRKI